MHLLGVLWGLFSSLFFFFFSRYWVSITFWWEDIRLISDKTRINNCSSSRGQVFSLGIRLTRLIIPRSAEFILLFSAFSARHYFGILVSFISQIMFLVFQRAKATPYASSSFEE